jgi:hypothetical protein
MNSENPLSGDNQQETERTSLELDAQYVVGFVDGEGCFFVSIHRNPHVRRTRGWQIQAVFQVSQHTDHRALLEALTGFFGCGTVRGKGAGGTVDVFVVSRLGDLCDIVVPFFEQHPLVVKQADFQRFAVIVRGRRRKEHLADEGFERIVRLAYGMNANGKQRGRSLEDVLEGSSETVRQARGGLTTATMRQSDPHGDMGSWAEMTQPSLFQP